MVLQCNDQHEEHLAKLNSAKDDLDKALAAQRECSKRIADEIAVENAEKHASKQAAAEIADENDKASVVNFPNEIMVQSAALFAKMPPDHAAQLQAIMAGMASMVPGNVVSGKGNSSSSTPDPFIEEVFNDNPLEYGDCCPDGPSEMEELFEEEGDGGPPAKRASSEDGRSISTKTRRHILGEHFSADLVGKLRENGTTGVKKVTHKQASKAMLCADKAALLAERHFVQALASAESADTSPQLG